MNKQHIEKFIKEKNVVENAKKYWWAILIGVLILIYILGYAFGGPGGESSVEKAGKTEVDEDAVVSYIMHPGGDEAEYPIKFLMSHIVPSQTQGFVDNLNLGQEPFADLKEIYKMMRFSLLSDKGRFGVEDYWQSPAEVLVTKEGDNEDWANTFVSAALSYDSSFKCYVVAFETLLTSFCYTGEQYIWMDDDETAHTRTPDETDTQQTINMKIEEMLDMYSKRYRVTAGQKLKVLFAYNNKDFVQFANNDEFFDWAVGLSK
jgi:hypothetical protein